MNEIEKYKLRESQIEIEVQLEDETVWLTQEQMATLFGKGRTTVTEHIKNVFQEGELDEKLVCRDFRHTTKHGAIKGKTQQKTSKHYNLDVIISVGYRVKSKQGTQFRQWATQRIKDYLMKGDAFNKMCFEELQQTIKLISSSGKAETILLQEAKGLLEIINHYTNSFALLNQFDSNNFAINKLNEHITYEIRYLEARSAVDELRKQLKTKKEATYLFGNEKDEGFKSSLQSIVQTFGGRYLYPSIEEQAAHLLYFIIKNHSFSDGNKRIGAFLFMWFLEKNKHRFKKSGEVKINDNGLTALALLVAQSKPEEKEIMIKLIINLING